MCFRCSIRAFIVVFCRVFSLTAETANQCIIAGSGLSKRGDKSAHKINFKDDTFHSLKKKSAFCLKTS